jgi:hypothetical protein
VRRSIVAGGVAVLVATSVSGATEQPLEPIETAIPSPHFGTVQTGPFSPTSVRAHFRPLGPGAPAWARRLYDRSVRVLIALTDPRSGAMIAGERDGWDYVWPRDAAAGAIALQVAGLHSGARRAAWAVTVFPQPGLRTQVRRTLLTLTRESTPYGIPPMQGWTPGEVWTAPTAWSAWSLVELGNLRAADRLLAELQRAETPEGTLSERVDAITGAPTSTTPLAWSHAFAILALRARYG